MVRLHLKKIRSTTSLTSAMVVLFPQDVLVVNSEADHGEFSSDVSHRSSCCESVVCQFVFPIVVVTVGTLLVAFGLYSDSLPTRNALTMFGISVYITGVAYFMLINCNLRDCSHEQEGCLDFDDEISANY